jgi:hypothetical protein
VYLNPFEVEAPTVIDDIAETSADYGSALKTALAGLGAKMPTVGSTASFAAESLGSPSPTPNPTPTPQPNVSAVQHDLSSLVATFDDVHKAETDAIGALTGLAKRTEEDPTAGANDSADVLEMKLQYRDAVLAEMKSTESGKIDTFDLSAFLSKADTVEEAFSGLTAPEQTQVKVAAPTTIDCPKNGASLAVPELVSCLKQGAGYGELPSGVAAGTSPPSTTDKSPSPPPALSLFDGQTLIQRWVAAAQAVDGVSAFKSKRFVIRCGPSLSTHSLKIVGYNFLTRINQDQTAESVVCGSPLTSSFGLGLSGVPDRSVAAFSQGKTQRFGYATTSSRSALQAPFMNIRIFEPNQYFGYYFSFGVTSGSKGPTQFFAGPSFLIHRSIFITPGYHFGLLTNVGGGFNVNQLVPPGLKTLPTQNTRLTRFGIMISFPIPTSGQKSGSASNSTPTSKSTPKPK